MRGMSDNGEPRRNVERQPSKGRAANEEDTMHADIVGIAPDPAAQHSLGERKAGGHLLPYPPRAAQATPPQHRAAGRQPLRRAISVADLPCRSDPDLYFAESPDDVRLAKALCGLCPVRQACLAGALQRAEPCGVWGGELFLRGAIIPGKRARGRPPKSAAAAQQADGTSAWRSAS
jgi:WhiB family transcriptional regulator, redox-sensing transcriptional regulator